MNEDQLQIEPEISEAEPSSDEEDKQQREDEESKTKQFMPQEYHKAKRTVNKLVKAYFDELRKQLRDGAKLYLNKNKVPQIEAAITAYARLRYSSQKEKLQLKIVNEENKMKDNKYGIVCYLSESEKMVSYNSQGKVSVLQLDKAELKLPDVATPIPYQNNIYLLDPGHFDLKRRVFIPQAPAFAVAPDGKMQTIASPILHRIKCAIVRHNEFVFLLGGLATQRKIITNRCEKYNLLTRTSEQIPSLKHKHSCPSGCLIGESLWVFSSHYLECFDGKEWRDIPMPFGATFLPFQFLLPVTPDDILIFGGVSSTNEKSREVRIFNTRWERCTSYGDMLPQGISNERSSGSLVIQGCAVGISSVQAALYPQVGIKSNMLQVTYIFESSAYLNSIISI